MAYNVPLLLAIKLHSWLFHLRIESTSSISFTLIIYLYVLLTFSLNIVLRWASKTVQSPPPRGPLTFTFLLSFLVGIQCQLLGFRLASNARHATLHAADKFKFLCIFIVFYGVFNLYFLPFVSERVKNRARA